MIKLFEKTVLSGNSNSLVIRIDSAVPLHLQLQLNIAMPSNQSALSLKPKLHHLENGRLQTGRLQTEHFETPRFQCYELQRLD